MNAILEPLVWTGIDLRSHRHLSVETCIEDGNLRQAQQQIFDDFHPLRLGLNM